MTDVARFERPRVLWFTTPQELRELADRMDADWKENEYSATGWCTSLFGDDVEISVHNARDRHRKQLKEAAK